MKTDDVSVRVCVYITFEPTEQIPNKRLRNFFFNFFFCVEDNIFVSRDVTYFIDRNKNL